MIALLTFLYHMRQYRMIQNEIDGDNRMKLLSMR